MKYVKQIFVIMAVSLAAETLKYLLPLPIPAGIYGLALLLVLLMSGALKLSAVENVADFLVSVMPLMFIPAAAGLLDAWSVLRPVALSVAAITVATTVIVMVASGRLTQFLMGRSKKRGGAGK